MPLFFYGSSWLLLFRFPCGLTITLCAKICLFSSISALSTQPVSLGQKKESVKAGIKVATRQKVDITGD